MGCNNRAEVDAPCNLPARAAELKPMQQNWRGVLPCAVIEGIETSLFLEKDGTMGDERALSGRARRTFLLLRRWYAGADGG